MKLVQSLFFTIKYFILILLVINLFLIFILFFRNEITSLLFLNSLLTVTLIVLTILFLKISEKKRGGNREKFLQFIYSVNIQNKTLKGVEVGVLNGDYSEKIYNYYSKKFDFNLYLVDPWKSFSDYDQKILDVCYKNVYKKFKNIKKIKILKQTSEQASKNFDNESLDFVYIDGNHEYNHVSKDLNLWFPKLKSHGVLFGDDYSRSYGVHKAVNEFAFSNKLSVKFSDNYKQYCFIKN
jgi:c-di-AMP phosphodiesterase-like protein